MLRWRSNGSRKCRPLHRRYGESSSSSYSSAPSPLPYTIIALLVCFVFVFEFEFKQRRFKGCNCSGGEHVIVVQLKKKNVGLIFCLKNYFPTIKFWRIRTWNGRRTRLDLILHSSRF